MERFWERVRAQAMSGEGIGRRMPSRSFPSAMTRCGGCSTSPSPSAAGSRGTGSAFAPSSTRSPGSARRIAPSARNPAVPPPRSGNTPSCPGRRSSGKRRRRRSAGPGKFSIVASGLAMRNREELTRVGDAVDRIRTELGLETCVSLGTLPPSDVEYLLSRGLRSVHHNLETSRSFFPKVCTTHDYEEDVAAVRAAKAAGAWSAAAGSSGWASPWKTGWSLP